MSKLVKNTIIYAIGDIVPKLFGLITFPLITNHLPPEDYAIINYVNAINSFLIIFSVLCLNTYFLVYYYKQNTEKERKLLLGNLSLFLFLFNIALTVLISIVGFYFWDNNDIAFFPYVFIGLLINFFSIFYVLPSALYRLREKPMPLTILSILRGVVTLIVTYIIIRFYNCRVVHILLSQLFITLIFSFIYIYIIFSNSICNINIRQLFSALKFALPLVPGSISAFIVSISDRILIEKYTSLYFLGIYGAASTIAMTLNIVSMGAYKAFEPHFFKTYGNINFDKDFNKITDMYLSVILLFASIISLFSKELLGLLISVEYSIAYLYIPPLLLGLVFSSLFSLYSTIVTAREKTKINTLITIIGSMFSISINVLFLKHYGIIAACFASIISFFCMFVMSYKYSNINRKLYKDLFVIFITIILNVTFVYFFTINSILFSVLVKLLVLSILMFIYIKYYSFNLKQLYGTIFK